jgi:hypothetical protein
MHYPDRVRSRKALGDLLPNVYGPTHGQRPAFDHAAERFAIHEFGDDERHIASVAHIENADDIRMVESSDCARFDFETRLETVMFGDLLA